MGWGSTLAAALGGAASGAMEGYQVHEGLRLKSEEIKSTERINQLRDEIRQMVASTAANARVTSATIGADSRERIAGMEITGRQTLQSLINAGNIDVERLRNDGRAYVQELHNQGVIDAEELRAINRLNLQKEINAGTLAVAKEGTTRATTVANITGQTARDVANTNAQADRDVAGLGGFAAGTGIFVDDEPLPVYNARTRRMEAQRPRGYGGGNRVNFGTGGDLGGPVTAPNFGPAPGTQQLLRQGTPSRTPYRPSVPGLATPAPPTPAFGPSMSDLDADYPDQPDWTPSLDVTPGAAGAAAVPETSGQQEIINLGRYLEQLMRERDASTDPRKRLELQSQIRQLRDQLKAQTGR